MPANIAQRFRPANSAIPSRASTVADPTCGNSTTFSNPNNPSSTTGSRSYTSRPAAKIRFSRNASTSATSSTTGPRAVFTSTAVGFINESSREEIKCRVSPVNGTCTETKSLSRNNSSNETNRAPKESISALARRLLYNTRIPNPLAIRANRDPIRPAPITPIVFPTTLIPKNCNGPHPSHFFARNTRSASPARRAAIISNIHAVSAVASVSTPGVLPTLTPRRLHAARSILFVPTANCETARTPGRASRNPASTRSVNMLNNPSTPLVAANNSSADSARSCPDTTTSCPASRSTATPTSPESAASPELSSRAPFKANTPRIRRRDHQDPKQPH